MPTHEQTARFVRDFDKLAGEDQARFLIAVAAFVADLSAGQGVRAGLGVKRLQGTTDLWEFRFAPDGRAVWQYGPEVRPGHPHIIWRRIGGHGIFGDAR